MNKVRHSYDGGGVQITFGIIYIMRFISVASVMVTVTEIGINQQSSNSSRVQIPAESVAFMLALMPSGKT